MVHASLHEARGMRIVNNNRDKQLLRARITLKQPEEHVYEHFGKVTGPAS